MSIERFGRADGRWGYRAALLLGTVLASGISAAALAQTDVPPPPERQSIDHNGVDLATGKLVVSDVAIAIGTSERGMAYARQVAPGSSVWNDNTQYALYSTSGTSVVAVAGTRSIGFDLVGGAYVNATGGPESLSGSSGTYTLTMGDGTIIALSDGAFDHTKSIFFFYRKGTLAVATSVTNPNGEVLTFYYDQRVATGLPNQPSIVRVKSIVSSNGYLLKVEYPAVTGFVPNKVYLLNLGAEYCDPSAPSCTLVGIWPTLTFSAAGGVDTTTDTMGRATSYSYSSPGTVSGIKFPSSTSNDVAVTYSGPQISSVTVDGLTWNYSFTPSTGIMTAVVTNPDSSQRTIVSNTLINQPTSVTDELGRTTSYTYDSFGRVLTISSPEGNQVQYAYDARGNLTLTTNVAKSGSGLSNIVVSADYDSTCANPKTCNQPNWTRDAANNQTDYTYDGTHGGVLTVTQPAPTSGADRPQTRTTYGTQQAWYKNSGGSLVTSGVSTYLPTAISTCSAGSSCSGTAAETKVVIGYESGSSGSSSNLQHVTTTVAAGDASVSATTAITYDAVGNLVSLDGPLSGSDDTTTHRYNANRERVGTVSPDPDGAGALARRAHRISYDGAGRVSDVEIGTVAGTSDLDWAAFGSSQKITTTWSGRFKSKDVVTASSTTYQVTQYSYDALGRLECTALRMNPANWNTGSACTANTAGSAGPDRITKNTYDAVGRVTKVQTGYGATEQADEVTATYSDNGRVTSVTDAEGNKTTYEYDGHDRVAKTRLPDTGKGAGTSSSTDYLQPTYDANGNVTSIRLRDGTSIGYTYDTLNRPTAKDLPGGEPDVAYSYDLLGRLTGASHTGNNQTFTYDALGRTLTARSTALDTVNYNGTVSYEYDIAGRRTKMTWPNGQYINYEYLVTGETTVIRENGATSGVGVLATYAYDNLGRRTSLTYGNGVVTSYTVDNVSRLSSLTHNLFGSGDDVTTSFTYNPASQISGQTRTNDSYAWGGHLNLGRNYTSNGRNQLTAAGGETLSYDARGNLSSVVIGAKSDSFSYSSENLLTGATFVDPLLPTSSVALNYDPLGRLFKVQVGSVGQRFMYDGAEQIAQFNDAGIMQRRYVRGPGADEVLVEYAGPTTTTRTFLQTDERGSVVARTDATGAKIVINSYDEYGIPAKGNTGRFQYTGQAWIPELGMYYYKARVYSPTLGRFLQTDPIGYGDGMNAYAYVGNDPITGRDPSGTQCGYVTGSRVRQCGDSFDSALENVGVQSVYARLKKNADSGSGVTVYSAANIINGLIDGPIQWESDEDSPFYATPFATALLTDEMEWILVGKAVHIIVGNEPVYKNLYGRELGLPGPNVLYQTYVVTTYRDPQRIAHAHGSNDFYYSPFHYQPVPFVVPNGWVKFTYRP